MLEFALGSPCGDSGGLCVFFLWAIVCAPIYQGFGLQPQCSLISRDPLEELEERC